MDVEGLAAGLEPGLNESVDVVRVSGCVETQRSLWSKQHGLFAGFDHYSTSQHQSHTSHTMPTGEASQSLKLSLF